MAKDSPPLRTRRPRVDGERNRERLLEAAKQVFAEHGSAASLEQIARDANVGIGTLYRHFATREALIEAVYRQETDILVDAASKLLETQSPIEALRAWLLLFISFLETKQEMAGVLDTLIGGPGALYSGTPARISPPITMLVQRLNESGEIRIDLAPLDLLRAIVGVATIRPSADWKRHAIGLVELLLRGAASTSPTATRVV